jgi:hypothetical protein
MAKQSPDSQVTFQNRAERGE